MRSMWQQPSDLSLVRDEHVERVINVSATSAAASKKMINAAESKKNTKPLSLAMSSEEDLLWFITVIYERTGVIPGVLCY